MNIRDIRTCDLKPYENNPRINEDAVDLVAASIDEFGFKQPIVVDKDLIIIAGHTRWKAAQKLGLETVPCIQADEFNTSTGESLPIGRQQSRGSSTMGP